MQHKRYIISSLLFVLLTTIELHSQSIYLHKSNIITSHLINSLRNISYLDGKLKFTKIVGSSNEYIIDELNFLNFTNVVSYEQIVVGNRSELKLYPTLAKNIINIEQSTFKSGFTQVEILSISGSVFISEKVKVNASNFQIDVSGLLAGSYICKITNDQKAETIRFVKL